MSKYEAKIMKILREYIITNRKYDKTLNLQKEYSFNDLKYKKAPLRFDFKITIKSKSILIEVDGEQHFQKVKFFKNYEHMKENDRRKNRYCIQNNIPLYRIPYWDIDKINSIKDIIQEKYRVKSIYHNDNLIMELNK